tara:strand:- start:147 stop:377 length:231 start_codon:yes stop_codon:yes gene_type:complete
MQISFERRGFLILALAAGVAGMALNWSWLTAIGAVPLILGLAPCLTMCALGLCMKGGSKSCSSKSSPAAKPDITTD